MHMGHYERLDETDDQEKDLEDVGKGLNARHQFSSSIRVGDCCELLRP